MHNFKRRAIESGYNLFCTQLGIDLDRIQVTVFRGDKRAELDRGSIALWREVGIPDQNIRLGDRDGNWQEPADDQTACGPITELYVDGLKVWSVTFYEFIQEPDGTLTPGSY